MTEEEKAYNKMLAELTAKVGKLTDTEVARVLDILGQALKDIDQMVATTEWQAYQIPQFKESVERAISAFAQQYQAGADEALKTMWLTGIEAVDVPLQTVGISVLTSEINRSALEIMQGYSADLIKNLSADAIKRINSEITLGILGEKTPWEVMQSIGRGLGDKGIMPSIAHRAETITRTEMARVHSAAREARIRAVVDSTDGEPVRWMKKWISSGKANPRPHHAALNGKMVDVDKKFPGGIPYPHAPGLPAKEVINCGCTHVLTRADWEDFSKEKRPFEADIYD